MFLNYYFLHFSYIIFSFSLLLFLLFCVYTGAEIQAKKKEKKENFPQFGPEDLNYDYMYRYIIDWIEKKYETNKAKFSWFTFEKMGDNDYLLKIKRGANLKKVLARIVKEYKDVFLEKLENKSPKPKVQKGSQGGSGGPSASLGVPSAAGG